MRTKITQKFVLTKKRANGRLDDKICDIKGVESQGYKTIRNKFRGANIQGANTIVLYYHTKNIYSEELLNDGYNLYLRDLETENRQNKICNVYYIIEDKLYYFK
jgi:hypothetical protein